MLTAILVGLVVGAINGLIMLFIPNEPYKIEIAIATTIRNALVAILALATVPSPPHWWQLLIHGAIFGFLTALVVFLAKGGFNTKHGPLLAFGTLWGAIVGIAVWVVVIHLGIRVAP